METFLILCAVLVFCGICAALVLLIDYKILTKRNNSLDEKLISSGFTLTKNLKAYYKVSIAFDNINYQLAIKYLSGGKKLKYKKYRYADIISFEIIENGTTIYQTKVEGGITRAIIGGALFGGVGSLVGVGTARQRTTSTTANTYQIRLIVNDFNCPNLIIKCKNKKVAQEIYSTFEVIKYNN